MNNEQPNFFSDSDASVWLYLSGELAPSDRQAFERRLANEPALRDSLATASSVDTLLKNRSAERTLTTSQSARALQASLRLVREQTLLIGERRMRSSLRQRFHVPKWAWGTAAAAAIIVAFVSWINNSEPTQLASQNNGSLNPGGSPFDPNRGPGSGPNLSGLFASVEPEPTEGQNEIDSQIQILSELAVMSDPFN